MTVLIVCLLMLVSCGGSVLENDLSGEAIETENENIEIELLQAYSASKEKPKPQGIEDSKWMSFEQYVDKERSRSYTDYEFHGRVYRISYRESFLYQNEYMNYDSYNVASRIKKSDADIIDEPLLNLNPDGSVRGIFSDWIACVESVSVDSTDDEIYNALCDEFKNEFDFTVFDDCIITRSGEDSCQIEFIRSFGGIRTNGELLMRVRISDGNVLLLVDRSKYPINDYDLSCDIDENKINSEAKSYLAKAYSISESELTLEKKERHDMFMLHKGVPGLMSTYRVRLTDYDKAPDEYSLISVFYKLPLVKK